MGGGVCYLAEPDKGEGRGLKVPCRPHLPTSGTLIHNSITGAGGGGAWSFFEVNIFVGKMGEINKWPQGMVEIQPILM